MAAVAAKAADAIAKIMTYRRAGFNATAGNSPRAIRPAYRNAGRRALE
jgi:hypothetical protein